jgi:deoxyribonuclease V
VCFARGYHGPGAAGDAGWAAAALTVEGSPADIAVVRGEAAAPYEAGLLALREGPLLEAVARAMLERARGATLSSPEVLLVDATGRDHPRRAGLALHLGARLSIPTVGVTMRPLQAEGPWPDDVEGAVSPLRLDDQVVGYWLRTKRGARPLAIHAAWRTGPEDAVAIVRALIGPWRTPEPLRQARHAAREARAKDVG